MKVLKLFIALVSLGEAHGREADYGRDLFIYAGDKHAEYVIKDYQVHSAPSEDFPDHNSKRQHAEIIHEEMNQVQPSILMPTYGANRVVEFYSPWCGHCQKFKYRYIQVALEVKRLLADLGEVEFHAISCSAHHSICKDNNISEYPTIRAYKGGGSEFKTLDRFVPESIAEAFDILLTKNNYNMYNKEINDLPKHVTIAGPGGIKGPVDIIGASIDIYKRTKTDVYKDAALSFFHALNNFVFQDVESDRNSSINEQKKHALSEWLDLLYWSLPSSWNLHFLINELRTNMDTAIVSSQTFFHIVNNHHGVILDKTNHWTESCSRGHKGAGYSCGLWNLFHIMSIGVAERHMSVLGAKDRVSTQHAAKTLRNYVDHFIGCKECRSIFLTMYDNCGFKLCSRFKQKGKANDTEYWRDYSIWLWEVHNDVNKRLLTEQAKVNGIKLTQEDEEKVTWPSKVICPGCRKSNGRWDYNEVYLFLKSQYWPSGVHNFRYVVLNKIGDEEMKFDNKLEWTTNTVLVLLLFCGIIFWFWNTQRLTYSGLHNKRDL